MAQFKGDVNNDGRITMVDIIGALRAVAGIADAEAKARADVNNDGVATYDDLYAIRDHINGITLIDGVIY